MNNTFLKDLTFRMLPFTVGYLMFVVGGMFELVPLTPAVLIALTVWIVGEGIFRTNREVIDWFLGWFITCPLCAGSGRIRDDVDLDKGIFSSSTLMDFIEHHLGKSIYPMYVLVRVIPFLVSWMLFSALVMFYSFSFPVAVTVFLFTFFVGEVVYRYYGERVIVRLGWATTCPLCLASGKVPEDIDFNEAIAKSETWLEFMDAIEERLTPQQRDVFPLMSDVEHVEILYIFQIDQMRIRSQLGRSRPTMIREVRKHNEAVDKEGFCSICKRAGGKDYATKIQGPSVTLEGI